MIRNSNNIAQRDLKPEKPPYRIPSMAEIAEVKGTNGLTVASTFSGCGGSCLGFEMAGYDVLWASEFTPHAIEVYELNHPGVFVDRRDIREVTAEQVLDRIGLARGELDVFDGSPPCISFSMAGSREKKWGKTSKYMDADQRSDDLFFEYIRLVDGIAPRAFVAENVTGLVRGNAFGYFKTIMAELKRAGPGYRVKAFNVNAMWLGVPQARKRIIIMGVREDLGLDPVPPPPLPYWYSIADACPWIQSVTSEAHGFFPGNDLDASKTPAPTVVGAPSGGGYYRHDVERGETTLEGTAIGKEYDRIPIGKYSKKYNQLIRANPNKAIPTITATAGTRGAAGVCHPTERRKFAIPEVLRLCSFPDDFQLTGSFSKQWERMGCAVPPRMMAHVARTLRDEVFWKLGMVSPYVREAI